MAMTGAWLAIERVLMVISGPVVVSLVMPMLSRTTAEGVTFRVPGITSPWYRTRKVNWPPPRSVWLTMLPPGSPDLKVIPERATAPVEATYERHRCIEGDGDCFLPVHEYCRACLSGCEDLGFPYQLLPWLSAGGKLARAGTLQLPGQGAARGLLGFAFHPQFERNGYFVADSKDHVSGKKAVFNRTVALKDSWAKVR